MFILQTVNRAYGSGDEIPWDTAHEEQFGTLAKARGAANHDRAEMTKRCGPRAWDGHRRIIPAEDTHITYVLLCKGRQGDGSHPWLATNISCSRDHVAVVVPWPAGEPLPGCPVPDGWANIHQCAECRAAEDAWERKQLEEWEQEQAEQYFFTAAEAERKYGVPRSSITLACRTGEIERAEIRDGRWRFPREDFLEWKRSRPGSGHWK